MISYRCTSCGKKIRTDELIYRCPHCSGKGAEGFQRGNLLVEQDGYLGPWKEPVDPLSLFPYQVDFYDSFPVGNTPLVKPEGFNHSGDRGEVFCKCEMFNPSGSYKDRASLLVAAQARKLGMGKVVLASTGNAGSAMSCAGAALGLEVVLFVPASAPVEKLAQSVYYGAKVIPIKGTYDDAFRLSLEYSARYGGLNRNTAYNPMTIEGKKSAAVEIVNQLGGSVPDIVYIPAGDGVIYSGMCKGFEDMKALGIIDSLPSCVAVQAEGSNAIYRSWKEDREVILDKTETMADSLAVCSPACGEPALQFMKSCDGRAVEVSDGEIREAQRILARKSGLFTEPSSAAALAGLLQDRQEGRVNGSERIVLLLTGTGYKDIKAVLDSITMPEAVEPSMEAVSGVFREVEG